MSIDKLLVLAVACGASVLYPRYGIAQERTQVDLRYETLMERPERNLTTPGNQFGDQHSLESGSLAFSVVDISIPGNSRLAVEFRRSLNIEDIVIDYANPASSRMGDWELDLPRIEASYDYEVGWVTSDASRPTKNCSISQRQYMAPPASGSNPSLFPSSSYWVAPSAYFPGKGSKLLVYNEGLVASPSAGGPYFWLTNELDYVSCLATLKNAGGTTPEELRFGASEGYLLVRADGTKYWFDWMAVDKTTPSITADKGSSVVYPYLKQEFLRQAKSAIYATRVEDVFGNWVKYTYSNKSNEPVKLDRIEASDGRLITIGYDGRDIVSASSNGRSWSYSYDRVGRIIQLTSVTNPDGSSWQYSGLSKPSIDWALDRNYGSCADPASWTGTQNPDATAGAQFGSGYKYFVRAPSGALAEFQFAPVVLGRSGVIKQCRISGWKIAGGLYQDIFEQVTRLGGKAIALVSKTIKGPGLSDATWKYHYQSDIGYLPFTGGTSRTKVLSPDGLLRTYVYGNVYKGNEGQLLSIVESVGGAAIRTTNYQYAINGAPFPKRIGWHPNIDLSDYSSAHIRPTTLIRRSQDGTLFEWRVDQSCAAGFCLDSFGRPIKIVESNAPLP